MNLLQSILVSATVGIGLYLGWQSKQYSRSFITSTPSTFPYSPIWKLAFYWTTVHIVLLTLVAFFIARQFLFFRCPNSIMGAIILFVAPLILWFHYRLLRMNRAYTEKYWNIFKNYITVPNDYSVLFDISDKVYKQHPEIPRQRTRIIVLGAFTLSLFIVLVIYVFFSSNQIICFSNWYVRLKNGATLSTTLYEASELPEFSLQLCSLLPKDRKCSFCHRCYKWQVPGSFIDLFCEYFGWCLGSIKLLCQLQ